MYLQQHGVVTRRDQVWFIRWGGRYLMQFHTGVWGLTLNEKLNQAYQCDTYEEASGLLDMIANDELRPMSPELVMIRHFETDEVPSIVCGYIILEEKQ